MRIVQFIQSKYCLKSMTQQLQTIIDAAWENRANISCRQAAPEGSAGRRRARHRRTQQRPPCAWRRVNGVGQWTVHQWIKKAVLLSFRLKDNELVMAGATGSASTTRCRPSSLHDCRPCSDLKDTGVRMVPPAVARRGSYIAKGAILMPSYVNIGAYVGEGTMVDTWATVGSCAQIGANVHLSGGVGIGGVLEPLQAGPTIIEDNCFIGARSEVVEGVIVEETLRAVAWACTSARARPSLTAPLARSATAACPRARW